MRFFGSVLQEWLDHKDVQDADDDPMEREIAQMKAALSGYQSHIDSLPGFPEEIKPIAHPFLVDDALFVRAFYESAKARLLLILRCGNNPDGYFDLVLNYGGVDISPHDLAELARAARGAKTDRHYWHDAYCHELDVLSDGAIEHSFLFHSWSKWLGPDQWERVPPVTFTIRCKTLTWERIERSDRKLPRLKDRFRVVGPATNCR